MRYQNILVKEKKNSSFFEGMKDGVPICLGYFAVSFSLGIAAKNAGLSVIQGFLASFLCNASAGEYAGFTLIAADAAYTEVIVLTAIVNARYLLMSFALSQKADSKLPLFQRFLIGYDITDEIFGISIARKGPLDPFYMFGAIIVSIPGWSIGTAIGITAGNLLPQNVVSALSVALYGMFLAIIIPPARKSKIIAGVVTVSFALSFAFSKLPLISNLSVGGRTIILTIAISAFAALLFPIKSEEEVNEA